MSIRKDLEARFGIAFGDLMQRFADIDFSRSDTAAVLNVSYQGLIKLLNRHGDPFPAQPMTIRYRQDSGETVSEAIQRLAPTHTLNATAHAMGISLCALRNYLAARRLDIKFRKRARRTQRLERHYQVVGPSGRPRETSPTWCQYEAFGHRGSLRELTELFGVVGLSTVRRRVHKGNWTIEKALCCPYIEVESRMANIERMRALNARYRRQQQRSS